MVRMVGAMPAVAVRQQRRHGKHEDAKQRPSTLTMDQSTPSHQGITTPMRSPEISPPHSNTSRKSSSPVKQPKTVQIKNTKIIRKKTRTETCLEGQLCGVVSLVQVSVTCVTTGIIFFVWGVILLVPGSKTMVNKYAVLGIGTGLLIIGFSLLIFQCAHYQMRMRSIAKTEAKQKISAKKRKGRANCSVKNGQRQIQTIDGALAGNMRGRTRAEVHPINDFPTTDFKIANENIPTTPKPKPPTKK